MTLDIDHDAIMDMVESLWAMLNTDNVFSIVLSLICAFLIALIVRNMLKSRAENV